MNILCSIVHLKYRLWRHSIFKTLGKITDANKVMNPRYFGSDMTDIRIRIWINLEICIWIPDHFWLKLDALAELCALRALSGCLAFATLCYASVRPMSSCGVCLSVCLPVTFIDSVKTNKHIFFFKFSRSGMHSILVFSYQTLWQYFNGVDKNRDYQQISGCQVDDWWSEIS